MGTPKKTPKTKRPAEVSAMDLVKQREAHEAREDKALELFRACRTYDEIASDVGYANPSSAWHAVQRSIARHRERMQANKSDAILQEHLATLQVMRDAIAARATTSANDIGQVDYKAQELMLRILDREAKLMGLDAAQKVEITKTPSQMTDKELEAWILELRQREQTVPAFSGDRDA